MSCVDLFVHVMFSIELRSDLRVARRIEGCLWSKEDHHQENYDGKDKINVKIPMPAKIVGDLSRNKR